MDIKKIAVLGSGTMGHGIAQAAAFAGFEVSIYDVGQELLDKALSQIKGNIERHFVKKGEDKPGRRGPDCSPDQNRPNA